MRNDEVLWMDICKRVRRMNLQHLQLVNGSACPYEPTQKYQWNNCTLTADDQAALQEENAHHAYLVQRMQQLTSHSGGTSGIKQEESAPAQS